MQTVHFTVKIKYLSPSAVLSDFYTKYFKS